MALNTQLSCASIAFTFAGYCPALAQAPLVDVFGQNASEALGSAVVGLGDVDGDGIGDVAVGAKKADGLQLGAGVVRIFSGFDGHLIRQIKGERSGDDFGHALDAVGDQNFDGVTDLIVGAPYYEPAGGSDRGAVYVYSGATGALLKKVEGQADGDQLGFAVSGVPDATGDGVTDYLFSAPWADSGGKTDNGSVWLYYGWWHTQAPFGFSSGGASGDALGYSLDGLEDFTGDGFGDLLLGAPFKDIGALVDAGQVSRKSGATGAGYATFNGDAAFGWLGKSVVGLPDVNGDGEPEFAVGQPFVSIGGIAGSGSIRVYSSINGAVMYSITGGLQENYGWVLGALEDFDGDGKGDLLVGVPFADFGGFSDVGALRIYSGVNGALLHESRGLHGGESCGASVGSAGDVNGDGVSDALLGATKNSNVVALGGRARVLLGDAPLPSSYCTAKTNSAGCLPRVSVNGCASTTVGQLTIRATEVLPNISGLLFWSRSPTAVPFHGGTLCVGAPQRRTPVQQSVVNGAGWPCTGLFSYTFSHAQMQLEGLVAGNQIYAQFWMRDPGFAPPNNTGLTDGMSITILP